MGEAALCIWLPQHRLFVQKFVATPARNHFSMPVQSCPKSEFLHWEVWTQTPCFAPIRGDACSIHWECVYYVDGSLDQNVASMVLNAIPKTASPEGVSRSARAAPIWAIQQGRPAQTVVS